MATPTTSTAAAPAVNRRLTAPARLVVGVLLAATVLKFIWAMTSAGSVDAVLFFDYAGGIQRHGLCALYAIEPKFNHTPLTGAFTLLLLKLAGGDYLPFAFFLRLTCIVADVAVGLTLLAWRERLGSPPWWSLVLFAASPVSLMISGFHGNVDPIMTAALFFAALASVAQRPALSGLLFGLACNVKVVPLVLAPVFFFFWMMRGQPWRFTLAAAAVGLAGSALPLIVCPHDYLRNVFGYGSTWGVWGISYALKLTGWAAVQKVGFNDLSSVQLQIASVLKFAAIAGIVAVAWLRRRVAAAELPATLGLAWIVFFLCAPGIGVQYMVWFAPFLLLLDARSYTLVTTAATVLLFVFYQSCSKRSFPWFFALPLGDEARIWAAVGTFTWLAFAVAFYRQRRAFFCRADLAATLERATAL